MIRLERVRRDFQVGDQTVHALNNIDLQISRGEYVSVMGPSGSGKSTLLNIVGILDHATAGKYFLDDQDVTEMDEQQESQVRNRNIGFVFQSFHLIPRMTAEQNIELPLMLAAVDPDVRKQKVAGVMQALSLEDRAHHTPDQLSGGQRQRVAIARAAVTEPSVLLADEPTGNLDRHSGNEVIETLEALNRQGITLIIVTHDRNIGDRSIRSLAMVDGRIESDQSRAP